MDNPKFMRIREVAKLGIISEHKLREMAHNKELPCIYAGKTCLVNVGMLIAQLDEMSKSNVKHV